MSGPAKTRVLGIDPAPSKITWIYTDELTFIAKQPGELADYLQSTLAANENLLITWDAPLSFDPINGWSDRPIDKAVRRAIKAHARVSGGAVSVLPFGGCPHWTISCHVLGYPVGPAKLGLRLVDAPGPGRRLAEVHPAVALAAWWVLLDCPGKLPKYKGVRGGAPAAKLALATIADALASLDPPKQVRDNDDRLDAWVAWKLGHGLLTGDAELVGSVAAGGYLLPVGAREALGLSQTL